LVSRETSKPGSTAQTFLGGSLIVVADARIDNGDQLSRALGLPVGGDQQTLIGTAYRKWGLGFAEHFLGDFAIALWDSSERRLVCVRDPIGVKPLFVANVPGGFFFASEIKAILASGRVGRDSNDVTIARFVEGQPPDGPDTTYKNVKRLMAGHCIVVVVDGDIKTHRYHEWKRPARFQGSDAVDDFRETFTRSVEARLNGAGRPGAMLSGGLDSSAITGTAARLQLERNAEPLTTISQAFSQEGGWSERSHMDAVIASVGTRAIVMDVDVVPPLARAERDLEEFGGLFFAPGVATSRSIYERAAADGVDVLLDGHGGDEVVSFGWGRYRELAYAGRWVKLWSELSHADLGVADDKWSLLLGLLPVSPLGSLAAKAYWRSFGRGYRNLEAAPLVSQELLVRIADASISSSQQGVIRTEQDLHFRTVTDERQALSFEILDCIAARSGVEARYPFWDMKLVDLCLSLPSHEKLDGGWSRLVLRRAMEISVPHSVRWRRDKLNFGPHLATGLVQFHQELLNDLFLTDRSDLSEFVDIKVAREAYLRFLSAGGRASGNDVQVVWRLAMLAIWLQSTKARAAPYESSGREGLA
jgi:asparagine synthase (glutamine-hydrolysing)